MGRFDQVGGTRFTFEVKGEWSGEFAEGVNFFLNDNGKFSERCTKTSCTPINKYFEKV